MTSDEIDATVRGVIDRSLPKARWTHAAHFAAALWLLDDRGNAAFTDMPGLIRRYNMATGVPNTDTDGYHHTITLASLGAAKTFLTDDLAASLTALLASPYGRSDWVLAHWSKERLFSIAARRGWRAPDKAPLPFPIPGTSAPGLPALP